jgi:outer membrane protein assembly factor BamB
VAEEASGIGENVMHCNWSSPAYGADLAGNPTVVFGAGDGFTYGFHATEFDEEKDGDDTFNLFKELWKVDCCPKEYRFDESGEPIKYATYPGPSEIISSPVIYNDKVYAAIGQDPEHGEGVGCVTCIDPSKGTGEDAIVWQFKEIGRTISTPSVVDGLVYIADYSGRLFCIDAETGEKYWEHDTLSHIWGSTLVVDGKVLLGNEDGELVILKAGKEYEEINTVGYPAPIYATPIVANGTLYVMTQTHLYAYEMGEGAKVAAK